LVRLGQTSEVFGDFGSLTGLSRAACRFSTIHLPKANGLQSVGPPVTMAFVAGRPLNWEINQ
jgi:hypothetical protein